MSKRASIRAVAIVLCLVSGGSDVEAEDHPNLATGFGSGGVFDVNGIESVALFNGNLTLTIPIGQSYPVNGGFSYGLTLVYNSSPWTFLELGPGSEPASLPRRTNAGLGWEISLGDIQGTGIPDNPWRYIGPDGSDHRFYDTLHEGEPNSGDYFYSRDGSYLRLRSLGLHDKTVTFPDGTIHTFHREAGDPAGFRLMRIEDPHGNWMSVDYTTYSDTWRITDSQGRYHDVHLGQGPANEELITQIDLASFDDPLVTTDGRALYDFTYTDTDVQYSAKDEYHVDGSGDQEWITVALLTEIKLPGPEAERLTFEILDGATPAYYTTTVSGEPDHSGLIKHLDLATGGRMEWTYQSYSLPAKLPGSPPWFVNSTGVATRTHRKPGGSALGGWIYTQQLTGTDARRDVIQPTGDCAVHYFYANADTDGPTFSGWDHGLPYSRTQPQSGDMFLSSQIWPENDGTVCTGSGPIRETYLLYEHDQLPPEPGIDEDNTAWYNTNRRLLKSRTIYRDDANRYADTTFSNFDGLGHYRESVTGGDFPAGNVRSSSTDFNWNQGEYRIDPATNSLVTTYTPKLWSEPWILGTFREQSVTEGLETAKSQYCFNPLTGFLEMQRTLVGSTPGASDLMAVFTPDSEGNVIMERYFGGDRQATLGVPGVLCDLTSFPGSEVYRIDHSYSAGVLATSEYMDETGTALGFLTVDLTPDPNTGLVASSRDSAGIETVFTYDELGRIRTAKPEPDHGAWTIYSYSLPNFPTSGVTVTTQAVDPGSPSTVLAQSSVELDGFGRTAFERQLMDSGSESTRATIYNARGWRTSISEQQAGTPTELTEFSEFDPLGRPGRISPPDTDEAAGVDHDIVLSYTGVREVARTVRVAMGDIDETASAVETEATTTESYDRQGRLHEVVEHSGESTPVTTTYAYDVGGRLSQVESSTLVGGYIDEFGVLQEASPVSQERHFTYDNRGFLISEQHPEKGASGNGLVTYGDYDARGHAWSKIDGPMSLAFEFDRAERLTKVDTPAGDPLKAFEYASTNGTGDYRQGKLWKATRHNYLGSAFNDREVIIKEIYTYGGVGGRVSSRVTQRGDNDKNGNVLSPVETWFTQDFTWTNLGDPDVITYPTCVLTPCGSSGQPARTVDHAYTNGFLTSVDGMAVAYHPNGTVASVAHSNGVVDIFEADPDGMGRPKRIRTSGATIGGSTPAEFDTGDYTYDGAGNVRAMGSDTFAYDAVSRLRTATLPGSSVTEGNEYDPFGNRTSVARPGGVLTIPTDSATNRLLGTDEVPVEYDSAGNVTVWGTATYTWDPFNMLLRLESPDASPPRDEVYVYTADDERLATVTVSPVAATWSVRGLDGKVLRQFSEGGGSWTWAKDYLYRGSQLLATDIDGIGMRHFHLDHLGTPRLITESDGSHAATHEYLPFGEEAVVNADGEVMRFTGHERDAHGHAPADCGPDTLQLSNTSITSDQVACTSITADPNVDIPSGSVRFKAGETIALGNGFSVASGAEFVAELDQMLAEGVYQSLDYMHARYSSPLMGRFLSPDPVLKIRDAMWLPQRWNQYAYVSNNPQKFIDPFGETMAFSLVAQNVIQSILLDTSDDYLREVLQFLELLQPLESDGVLLFAPVPSGYEESANPAVAHFARAINSDKAPIFLRESKLGSLKLKKNLGAVTHQYTDGTIEIKFNRRLMERARVYADTPSGNLLVKSSFTEIMYHEFGHAEAMGEGHAPQSKANYDRGISFENVMRELRGNPIMRKQEHSGCLFPKCP